MSSVEQISEPLVAGERLSREEFMRRWELLPDLKKAELIDGVVYMPSPLSTAHCTQHSAVGFWLFSYASSTPGCEAGIDGTWLMLEDAPQPDAFLRILTEYGGQSRVEGIYYHGAPDFTDPRKSWETLSGLAEFVIGLPVISSPKISPYRPDWWTPGQ